MTPEEAREMGKALVAWADDQSTEIQRGMSSSATSEDEITWVDLEDGDIEDRLWILRRKPKPRKAWVNIYSNDECSNLMPSKECADASADACSFVLLRIACIEVEIPPNE